MGASGEEVATKGLANGVLGGIFGLFGGILIILHLCHYDSKHNQYTLCVVQLMIE